MNETLFAAEGFSPSLLAAFKGGFPEDWTTLLRARTALKVKEASLTFPISPHVTPHFSCHFTRFFTISHLGSQAGSVGCSGRRRNMCIAAAHPAARAHACVGAG